MAALGIVFGRGRVGLDMGVVDFGKAVGLLAHQIGRLETSLKIAELGVDLAQYIVGLFGVNWRGAGLHRLAASK